MSDTQSNSILESTGLSCIRDDWTLFEDLSFKLGAGQALLLEGRNGSGKTSLLKLLCGIRQPDAGTISWEGEDIASLGADYHVHIAYVGHKDGIKADLTASENLKFARGLGVPDEMLDIESALDRVELSGLDDTPARNLSAGQQRRLALARLLVTRAALWILDEPFTSLDSHGITLVEQLFSDHLAGGGMLAVTSHHPVQLSTAEIIRINLSV